MTWRSRLVRLTTAFLRWALRRADASTGLPDRIQSAYDALSEGVVVLDVSGSIVLANTAFARLAGPQQQLLGRRIESLPILAASARQHDTIPPWHVAIKDRIAVLNQRIDFVIGNQDKRVMVVSCTPIHSSTGALRGCIVVFLDRTEIEQSNEKLNITLSRLKASTVKIEQQNEELRRLATTDSLSGMLNRRAFFEHANALCEAARRHGQSVSCLLFDIDYFKRINDNHGHQAGDRAIAAVAHVLQSSARSSDVVCRYGGEEFGVFMPATDAEQAMEMAERIRWRIEHEVGVNIRIEGKVRITTSVGVASGDARQCSVEALLAHADGALYRAKLEGRNRARLADDATEAAPVRATTGA